MLTDHIHVIVRIHPLITDTQTLWPVYDSSLLQGIYPLKRSNAKVISMLFQGQFLEDQVHLKVILRSILKVI